MSRHSKAAPPGDGHMHPFHSSPSPPPSHTYNQRGTSSNKTYWNVCIMTHAKLQQKVITVSFKGLYLGHQSFMYTNLQILQFLSKFGYGFHIHIGHDIHIHIWYNAQGMMHTVIYNSRSPHNHSTHREDQTSLSPISQHLHTAT